MEEELARHLMDLESSFFELTAIDFRKLAFELAEKFQLPYRFNEESKMVLQIYERPPTLSLRVPEPTLKARSKGFNKERVNEYEEILDEQKLTAGQIYNMDETALSTVHKHSKAIAQNGKHQADKRA